MVSGTSSPVFAHVHLHPGSSTSSQHGSTNIRRPPASGSASASASASPSSSSLLGVDGELHDPGYSASLQDLRSQMEQSSFLGIAASSSGSSPLHRRATFQSGRRRSSLLSSQFGQADAADHDDDDDLSAASDEEGEVKLTKEQADRVSPKTSLQAVHSLPQRETRSRKGNGLSGLQSRSNSLRSSLRSSQASAAPHTFTGHSDIWQNGFTGLVDVQRDASRRDSDESANQGSGSRPASPLSSSSSANQIARRSSTSSGVQRSGALLSDSEGNNQGKRRSSDGSVRHGLKDSQGARRFSNFAQETLLRKARSESDPAPLSRVPNGKLTGVDQSRRASAPQDEVETQQNSIRGTHRLSPILSTGSAEQRAAHAQPLRLAGSSFSGGGFDRQPADALLTPLDEDGGYRDFAAAAAAVSSSASAKPARKQQSEQQGQRSKANDREQDRSPRSARLGRRPSSKARIFSTKGGGRGGGGNGANDEDEGDSEEADSSLPVSMGRNRSNSSSSHTDLDAVRRKLQYIGLGVRIKAMRAERKIKDVVAGTGAERSRAAENAV
ncbi:unnamed protein product [Jaminaea pallidilutea]